MNGRFGPLEEYFGGPEQLRRLLRVIADARGTGVSEGRIRRAMGWNGSQGRKESTAALDLLHRHGLLLRQSSNSGTYWSLSAEALAYLEGRPIPPPPTQVSVSVTLDPNALAEIVALLSAHSEDKVAVALRELADEIRRGRPGAKDRLLKVLEGAAIQAFPHLVQALVSALS